MLSTPDAVLQRVPPRAIWSGAHLTLRPGRKIAGAALRHFLERTGYDLGPRVDSPGDAALHGRIVDLYPAGALGPVRIEHEGGRIVALYGYDLDSQRSTGDLAELVIDPASEIVLKRPPRATTGDSGAATSLARHYRTLETLFDYLPAAAVVTDPRVHIRAATWLQQVSDSYEAQRRVKPRPATGRGSPVEAPDRLFLDEKSWQRLLKRRRATLLPETRPGKRLRVPRFAAAVAPRRELRGFLEAQRAARRRVLLTAADERELKTLERRAGREVRRIDRLEAALAAPAGALLGLRADMEGGTILPSLNLTVVAATDVLGSRAAHEAGFAFRNRRSGVAEDTLRPGSVVIHWQRGVGVLRGLEKISAEDAADQDMLRLEFAGEATVLVPVDEVHAIWSYGIVGRRLPLDRADGSSWDKRRAELLEDIARTAGQLVAAARARDGRAAPKLVPPAAEYERFAARFRYFPSPDQGSAIEAVLSDLAAGRPMDRLVCGDVGFGKTEVALRGVAAAVLSGKQAAVAVPTTVLARQHYETFRRRFAGFGIEIGQLSRLAEPTEARAVKQGLANGSLGIVIGTHAIAGKDVRFRDLGLLVIDEEQRFGTEHKEKLRALAAGVHNLTMTATPIPRTLRLAAIGLRDMSVIATPPVRRLPIRTMVAPFQAALAGAALRYEKRRGGQSFVVTPRIEDMPDLQSRIAEAAPELDLRVVHGQMPPATVDDTMVRFADGDGDVLLATSLIETGLDLPRANTILICGPERFGVAQLHQMRGRVGRGIRRGFAYLLTDGEVRDGNIARRLRTIEEHTSLGSGFAISERDMALRGTGEILGTRQAGHLKLVGPALYRHLLERAVAAARGEPVPDDTPPEIHIDVPSGVPRTYIKEEEPRIELYHRLARATTESELEDLRDEIEDRFGLLPDKLQNLIEIARLRQVSRQLGIERIDAGPQAVALSFRSLARWRHCGRLKTDRAVTWREARMVYGKPSAERERLVVVAEILDILAAADPKPPRR